MTTRIRVTSFPVVASCLTTLALTPVRLTLRTMGVAVGAALEAAAPGIGTGADDTTEIMGAHLR